MSKDKVACPSMDNLELLKMRQGYTLAGKIFLTNERIKEWYEYYNGMVYISFSGGKDSTVLLHLVRNLYPEVPAVFFDTGLEFPEIRDFVKTIDNVVWVKPKKNFKTVLEEYGFPVVSKETSQKIREIRTTTSAYLRDLRINGNHLGHGKVAKKWLYLKDAPFKVSEQCCNVFKKQPAKGYETKSKRRPFVGTMACESNRRKITYLKQGCNNYTSKKGTSAPMSFWEESNVWEYLKANNLPYASVYDMGYDRTGCMFCMLGVHMEEGENRFQKMAKTHPKQHSYCMDKLGLREVLAYVGVTKVDKVEQPIEGEESE